MEVQEYETLLSELETRVDRLRALYDQYFMGIEKTVPSVPHKDVDRRITTLRREQVRNTALRFRFQMVLQRYNTYQTFWQRICRQIEEGTYKRHVQKAKAKAAERERKASGEFSIDVTFEDFEAEAAMDEEPVEPPPRQTPLPSFEPVAALASPFDDDDGGDRTLAGIPAPAGGAAPAPPGVSTAPHRLGAIALARMPAPRPAAGMPPPQAPVEPPAPRPAAGVPPEPRPAAGAPPPAEPPAQRMVWRKADAPRVPGAAPSAPQMPPAAPSAPQMPPAAPSAPQVPPAAASAPQIPPAAAQPKPAAPQPAATPPKPAAPQPAATQPKPAAAPPTTKPAEQAPPAKPAARPAVPFASMMKPGVKPGAGAPAPTPAAQASAPAPKPEPKPPPARPAAGAKGDLSDERMRQLYAAYVETKRSRAESTAGITYETLSKSLRESGERLRQKHGAKDVDFEVTVKDGKTILKPIIR